MRRILRSWWAGILTGTAVAAAPVSFCAAEEFAVSTSPGPQPLDAAIREHFQVGAYTVQRFEIAGRPWAPFSISVDFGAGPVEVALAPYYMRSDDFRVLVQGADGVLQQVEPPAPTTFRGDLPGDFGSDVRAGIVAGGLHAYIRLSNGQMWGIQPLSDVVPGGDPALHVVYRDADVQAPAEFHCGVPDQGQGEPGEPPPVGERNTGDRITDVAFDADVEYYVGSGSSVPATVNDIESILNGVESIYEAEVQISYELTTIVVRTAEPDPYSSSNPNTLLGQFDTLWSTASNVEFGIRRDVAHLMTGKNIDGGVIGIAQLTQICNAAAHYGLSQSRYTTNTLLRRSLTAHELGHNWSAQHCDGNADCSIMCSGNGGCNWGSFPNTFGVTDGNQIINHRNSRSCLFIEPAPLTAPFLETFPSTTIDTSRWVYNFNAASSAASVGPPSAPNALTLNAPNNILYRDDDIRTHFIQLAGVTSPVLDYWAEARGVPNGGQLLVDVWTSSLQWVRLNTVTSDGVDDPAFTHYVHTLSGAQIHNEFRVRFSAAVNGTTEVFYVDDVYVGSSLTPPTGACCQSGGVCTIISQAACATLGGTWQGVSTLCATCPQPPGACCLPEGGCQSLALEVLCLSAGGAWQGAGSTCAEANCPSPCACDWNMDMALNSQDFFEFLAVFFGGTADFNGDGSTNSQDFFDFLACFFAGC